MQTVLPGKAPRLDQSVAESLRDVGDQGTRGNGPGRQNPINATGLDAVRRWTRFSVVVIVEGLSLTPRLIRAMSAVTDIRWAAVYHPEVMPTLVSARHFGR